MSAAEPFAVRRFGVLDESKMVDACRRLQAIPIGLVVFTDKPDEFMDELRVTSLPHQPAGATLGLRYAGYHDTYGSNDYVSPYNSGLYAGIHLGSRYMFSEKVGGFAEVGYGISALRLGVRAKF